MILCLASYDDELQKNPKVSLFGFAWGYVCMKPGTVLCLLSPNPDINEPCRAWQLTPKMLAMLR